MLVLMILGFVVLSQEIQGLLQKFIV